MVSLQKSDKMVTVSVSKEWRKGIDEFGQGWIGEGQSKCAIFGKINGESYAITQPILTVPLTQSAKADAGKAKLDFKDTEDGVFDNLLKELKLLVTGQFFASEFFQRVDLAREQGFLRSTVPKFKFHTEGACVGRTITLLSPFDHNTPLPHESFLATRLLPHGPTDPKFRKFNGHDPKHLVIPDKEDHIASALYAFMHFVLLMSKNKLIICDLQGCRGAMEVGICLTLSLTRI